MLKGSSQYTFRKHLTAMPWEVVIRDNYSKIIVFPLGFREAFSLLPFCLCGFIWSNTMELGGFGKDTCLADKSLYNLLSTQFGSVDNGGHSLRTEKIFVGKTSSGFPEDINREDEVNSYIFLLRSA